MTSGIELELQEVSEVKQKKKEDRQDYLIRLMRAVADVPDDIWGSLSKDAQDWNNDAATAFKEDRDIDDFPEEDEEPEEEETNVEALEEPTEGVYANGGDGTFDESDPEPNEGPSDAWNKQTAELGLESQEEQEQPVVKRGPGRPRKSESESQTGMVTKIRGKNTSACHKIKRMVVKKPYITVDEITSALKVEGLKVTPVTIATLRSSVRDTLRVLNEENLGTFRLNNHSAD
jgi:hypothetical protein